MITVELVSVSPLHFCYSAKLNNPSYFQISLITGNFLKQVQPVGLTRLALHSFRINCTYYPIIPRRRVRKSEWRSVR